MVGVCISGDLTGATAYDWQAIGTGKPIWELVKMNACVPRAWGVQL